MLRDVSETSKYIFRSEKLIYLHKKTIVFYLVHALLLNDLSTEKMRNDVRDRDHHDTYSPLILNKSTLCYAIKCSKTFFYKLTSILRKN